MYMYYTSIVVTLLLQQPKGYIITWWGQRDIQKVELILNENQQFCDLCSTKKVNGIYKRLFKLVILIVYAAKLWNKINSL